MRELGMGTADLGSDVSAVIHLWFHELITLFVQTDAS